MIKYRKTVTTVVYALLFYGIALVLLPASSNAQDSGLMPPQAVAQTNEPTMTHSEETHPILRMTPDKSEIIRLEREAASIIVGREEHLRLFMDTPTLLVAVPGLPGATHFTILDDTGNVIMQRHVVVGSPQEKYVRVRRCDSPGCRADQVYFCPEGDMCHETGIANEPLSGASGAISLSGTGNNGTPLPMPSLENLFPSLFPTNGSENN
jgi:hypothetical protein